MKPTSNSPKFDWTAPFRHLVLVALIFLTLFPLYFIAINSVKNVVQYAQSAWTFPADPQWGNYALAWEQIAVPMVNSTIIVLVSVAGIVLLSALSAYAFAILPFPGKRFLFGLIFILLLIPGFLTLIPLFLQIKRLPISNTHLALILPYIAGGQAFAIFVLKTFFEGISKDLLDAARVDGADDIQTFFRICLPLSTPVLASVAIISLIPLWNDYLLPTLLLDQARRTVPMALVAFQGSAESFTAPKFGPLMAAYALAAVPLIVIMSFMMRSYVQGLTSGALKM